MRQAWHIAEIKAACEHAENAETTELVIDRVAKQEAERAAGGSEYANSPLGKADETVTQAETEARARASAGAKEALTEKEKREEEYEKRMQAAELQKAETLKETSSMLGKVDLAKQKVQQAYEEARRAEEAAQRLSTKATRAYRQSSSYWQKRRRWRTRLSKAGQVPSRQAAERRSGQ